MTKLEKILHICKINSLLQDMTPIEYLILNYKEILPSNQFNLLLRELS